MSIICNNETFDVSKIQSVTIHKASDYELSEIERKINGEYLSSQDVFSSSFHEKLELIIRKYRKNIGIRLPEPLLHKYWNGTRFNGAVYFYDRIDTAEPDMWRYKKYGEHTFTIKSFENNGNAEVLWEYEIERKSSSEIRIAHRTCTLEELIPIFKDLMRLPSQSTWERIMSREMYSYTDIQKDIPPIYNEYISGKKKIDSRNENMRRFFETNKNKSILTIFFNDNCPCKEYLEDCCGFNIFDKEKEILDRIKERQKEQKKVKNTSNRGESAVEYAIKWFLASHKGDIVSIKNDCESRYKYGCILLCKEDFLNEPQEYDHILVCPAGVVLIETKHWRGRVKIQSNGKWTREAGKDRTVIGVANPKVQMHRHEVLMNNILPSIPVHSLLCFSNPSTIVEGVENFKDYPIITIDQLDDYLTNLCNTENYSKEDIDHIVAIIESHKIHQKK